MKLPEIKTKNQFKAYILTIKDFTLISDELLILICWFGKTNASISKNQIQKAFNFTQQQIDVIWAEYLKRSKKNEHYILGSILNLNNFKTVCKNPHSYNQSTVLEFASVKFFDKYGFIVNILF